MGEEAVTESGCSASNALELLPGARRREQSLLGVVRVSDDVVSSGQAAFLCSVLDGRK